MQCVVGDNGVFTVGSVQGNVGYNNVTVASVRYDPSATLIENSNTAHGGAPGGSNGLREWSIASSAPDVLGKFRYDPYSNLVRSLYAGNDNIYLFLRSPTWSPGESLIPFRRSLSLYSMPLSAISDGSVNFTSTMDWDPVCFDPSEPSCSPGNGQFHCLGRYFDSVSKNYYMMIYTMNGVAVQGVWATNSTTKGEISVITVPSQTSDNQST
ncbi:hypothetical protein BGX21_000219 [Mortierella sp. AD011]|nr:hypothetical protein BGX21_000219 [Mortierella sp. AD011]